LSSDSRSFLNQPNTAFSVRSRESSDFTFREYSGARPPSSTFRLRVNRPLAYFNLKSPAIRSVTSAGPLARGNMAFSLPRVSM